MFDFDAETLFCLSHWDENIFLVKSPTAQFDWVLGLGAERKLELTVAAESPLDFFDSWHNPTEWTFCIWSYELKNSIEKLSSKQANFGEFPVVLSIQPSVVIGLKGNKPLVIKNNSPLKEEELLAFFSLKKTHAKTNKKPSQKPISLQPTVQREQYIIDVEALLQHIRNGNIYEINYCQEFSAKAKLAAPFQTWKKLYAKTKAPSAAFVQSGEKYLLCASPERYLHRKGNTVQSFPIKGTIRRGVSVEEDELLKQQLLNNPKEKSENVMIVDLVRNDLSKSAEKGSVQVDELFGIYSFPTVHHMISTVSAQIPASLPFSQLLRDTFPMGSMTGAPKVSAMQLIDAHEKFNRAWYSGSVGCISPDGDAEFNVVIRSLLVNAKKQFISLSVGSAITATCDPQKEYDECLLKADALIQVLKDTE
jgi:para-aminobenzoate synthetase component I